MKFRDFLLNEDHAYLGQRVGDVLSAIHQLEEDADGMGTRHLVSSAENIVRQLRRILHTSWARSEIQYLPPLQKSGVAIMKAIEEKQDLRQILTGVKSELEKLSARLGAPQNHLASPEPTPEPVDAAVAPPEGKEQKPTTGA
jgi:hypothetical protein